MIKKLKLTTIEKKIRYNEINCQYLFFVSNNRDIVTTVMVFDVQ